MNAPQTYPEWLHMNGFGSSATLPTKYGQFIWNASRAAMRADGVTNLMEKIEAYSFESDGGPLHLCVDWATLKDAIKALEAENAKLRKHCEEIPEGPK